MTEFTIPVKQDVSVKHLLAQMQVCYWEDAKVNGEDESDDTPKMPLKDGDMWNIKIDLSTGMIEGWPQGVTAQTHYKVCDAGIYSLLNAAGEVVVERDWYVPSMLSPSGEGFGDYVIMEIDGAGKIEGWSPDLDFFTEDDD